MTDDAAVFTRFVEEVARPLRQALVARYGPDLGDEATAEALAYAWENWERIIVMSNASGYLYRVGQSRVRSSMRRRVPLASPRPHTGDYWYEPKLADALEGLSSNQRAAVVLVHGLGWSLTEVAEMWGVSFTTVQTHVVRAMTRLRRKLGVTL